MAESEVHEAGSAAITSAVDNAASLDARIACLQFALAAEQAYHANNSGENAKRYKKAKDMMPEVDLKAIAKMKKRWREQDVEHVQNVAQAEEAS